MAVTGAILFTFVIGHMLGNLQIFEGPEKINSYGRFLHNLGEILIHLDDLPRAYGAIQQSLVQRLIEQLGTLHVYCDREAVDMRNRPPSTNWES